MSKKDRNNWRQNLQRDTARIRRRNEKKAIANILSTKNSDEVVIVEKNKECVDSRYYDCG